MTEEGPNIKGEHVFTGDFRESEEHKNFYAEGTPLTLVFGETARAKILSTLLAEVENDLIISEISELAGVSRSTVYDHIDDLVDIGLVQKTRKIAGNNKYQINTDHRAVRQLMKVQDSMLKESLESK